MRSFTGQGTIGVCHKMARNEQQLALQLLKSTSHDSATHNSQRQVTAQFWATDGSSVKGYRAEETTT